ncbi:hypothetical protein D3C73_860300 [compost metagenome]
MIGSSLVVKYSSEYKIKLKIAIKKMKIMISRSAVASFGKMIRIIPINIPLGINEITVESKILRMTISISYSLLDAIR